MRRAGSLLEKCLEQSGLGGVVRVSRVYEAWEQIKDRYGGGEPVGYEGDVLFLSATGAALRSSLSLRAGAIVKELNGILGSGTVKGIKAVGREIG